MAVAWNDLARLEGVPDVFFDGLVRGVFAELRAHLLDPDQDFLVGKTAITTFSTLY